MSGNIEMSVLKKLIKAKKNFDKAFQCLESKIAFQHELLAEAMKRGQSEKSSQDGESGDSSAETSNSSDNTEDDVDESEEDVTEDEESHVSSDSKNEDEETENEEEEEEGEDSPKFTPLEADEELAAIATSFSEVLNQSLSSAKRAAMLKRKVAALLNKVRYLRMSIISAKYHLELEKDEFGILQTTKKEDGDSQVSEKSEVEEDGIEAEENGDSEEEEEEEEEEESEESDDAGNYNNTIDIV